MSKSITLRKEVCLCSNTCSTLFDGGRVVSTSWAQATLPKCWKKGSDLLVIRVDRREALADAAYEQACQL